MELRMRWTVLLPSLRAARTTLGGVVPLFLQLDWAVGDKMILALAVVTSLWLWADGTLGRYVVSELAAVVATYLSEPFLGEWTSM